MKISVITINDNANIGTYLQMYSLSQVLKLKGHHVEIVNYKRHHMTFFSQLKVRLTNKQNNLIKRAAATLYFPVRHYLSLKKINRFKQEYLSFTPRKYVGYFSLKKNPPIADLYMTGSDQVWNSKYNLGIDRSFYLDWIPDNKKRVAYGASIGMDKFDPKESNEIKRLLKKYNSISVRETSAITLLDSIGVHGAHFVIDPTLLLNKDEWMEITGQKSFNEKYLLVYSVEPKNRVIVNDIATKIAHEIGLKIYHLSTSDKRGKIDNCDKYFSFVSPQHFLTLFNNAEFLVVSSFHGTAFSINFNKQFVSVNPDKFNSRVLSLLKMCGIEERIITTIEEIESLIKRPIDYSLINPILSRKRRESDLYLDRALK